MGLNTRMLGTDNASTARVAWSDHRGLFMNTIDIRTDLCDRWHNRAVRSRRDVIAGIAAARACASIAQAAIAWAAQQDKSKLAKIIRDRRYRAKQRLSRSAHAA